MSEPMTAKTSRIARIARLRRRLEQHSLMRALGFACSIWLAWTWGRTAVTGRQGAEQFAIGWRLLLASAAIFTLLFPVRLNWKTYWREWKSSDDDAKERR